MTATPTFDAPLVAGLSSYVKSRNALTALAGGAKAGATQLNYGINNVTVVATDGDSVLMPPAKARAIVIVINSDAAQDIRLYGYGTDTINAVATATGNLQGEKTITIFVCPVDGSWFGSLGTAY